MFHNSTVGAFSFIARKQFSSYIQILRDNTIVVVFQEARNHQTSSAGMVVHGRRVCVVNDISVLEVQEEGRQLELKSTYFIENCSVSGCHELSIVFKCCF